MQFPALTCGVAVYVEIVLPGRRVGIRKLHGHINWCEEAQAQSATLAARPRIEGETTSEL